MCSPIHPQAVKGVGEDADDYGVDDTFGTLQLGGPGNEWGRHPTPFPFTSLPLTHLTLAGGPRAHRGLGRPLNAASSWLEGSGPRIEISVGEGLAQLPTLEELLMDGHISSAPMGECQNRWGGVVRRTMQRSALDTLGRGGEALDEDGTTVFK